MNLKTKQKMYSAVLEHQNMFHIGLYRPVNTNTGHVFNLVDIQNGEEFRLAKPKNFAMHARREGGAGQNSVCAVLRFGDAKCYELNVDFKLRTLQFRKYVTKQSPI